MRVIILALEKSRQVPTVAIFAVSAYVQPDYLLANVPLSTWSVIALMILVAANGVFLWFCIRRTFPRIALRGASNVNRSLSMRASLGQFTLSINAPLTERAALRHEFPPTNFVYLFGHKRSQ